MKQISNNGQPSRDGIREIVEGIILNSPHGIIGLIESFFVAILYPVLHERKSKLWNIVTAGLYLAELEG